MRRVARVATAGRWPAAAARDSVTLAWDDRHRRRVRLVSDRGAPFLLDLERATALGDGDGLALDDGGWVAVVAAPEPVAEVRTADPRALARLAWHLGNRHVPAQILDGGVRFRDDRVIVDMVAGLGAAVVRLRAPFDPERGAYHDRRGDG